MIFSPPGIRQEPPSLFSTKPHLESTNTRALAPKAPPPNPPRPSVGGARTAGREPRGGGEGGGHHRGRAFEEGHGGRLPLRGHALRASEKAQARWRSEKRRAQRLLVRWCPPLFAVFQANTNKNHLLCCKARMESEEVVFLAQNGGGNGSSFFL